MNVKRSALFCVFTLVYWLVTSSLLWYFGNNFESAQVSEQREQQRNQASIVRAQLESLIHRDVYAAQSLATLTAIAPDIALDNWRGLAANLLNETTTVRLVALSPDDVVSRIYPLSGNQRALGLDYTEVPEQYKQVQVARETKSLVLNGPLSLVQGGEAIIARFPIFNDYPAHNDYWGGMSVVIDFKTLLQRSHIESYPHLTFTIQGIDGLGKDGRIFYGSEQALADAILTFDIDLPHGKWLLGVTPTQEPPAYIASQVNLFYAFFIAVALVLYCAIALLYRAYVVVRTSAFEDELTGLANRRYFMNRLEQMVNSNPNTKLFALISIDLNDFKLVNDTYGHVAGDLLLNLVAQQLRQSVRESDIIARMGGDEFLILLHRVSDSATVENICSKIREQVQSTPLHYQGTDIYPSVSIGFSMHTASTVDAEALLAEADHAMYQDKQNINASKRASKQSAPSTL